MTGAIEKASDFPQTNVGWAERWKTEFEVAKKEIEDFHTQGTKIIKRFLDDRKGDVSNQSRLNLFHANVTTLQSMLYGRIPKIEVDRSHEDQNDDIARVASEILERMLNNDMQPEGGDYAATLRNCLEDRLLPGLGSARVRYQAEYEETNTEAVYGDDGKERAPAVAGKKIKDEWVETIYTNWKDQLWSPARTYDEIRWKAYRSYLTRDQLEERFTEEMAKKIPLKGKDDNSKDRNKDLTEAWQQAEVWEIWCKDTGHLYYYVDGMDEILEDPSEDPLKLDGFWPDPRPMIANPTTTKWMPHADFLIAQDLYHSIDHLQSRIEKLTEAAKLVGVYNKGDAAIQRVFIEGVENELIPVDDWAKLAEKGGLKGSMEWIPLEDVVHAIDTLSIRLQEKMKQLYEVTGMADVLRGAGDPRASATQDKLKSQYASVRVQAFQDEFARFASDLQRRKAEIIARVFTPESIIKYSNIQTSPDWEKYGQAAIQLIKSPDQWRWRILVRPESLAMIDYAQLKQDRTEFMNAIGLFVQSAAPILEMDDRTAPFLMQMMQWGLAGFKGSNQIEGVIDQAIDIMKTPRPPKPDPAAEKAKAEMQQAQQEGQQKMQLAQQDHQLKMQQQQQEHQLEMQKLTAEMQMASEKQKMELQGKLMEIQMEMRELAMKMTAQRESAQIKVQGERESAELEHESREQDHKLGMEERQQTHEHKKAEAKIQSRNKGNGGRKK